MTVKTLPRERVYENSVHGKTPHRTGHASIQHVICTPFDLIRAQDTVKAVLVVGSLCMLDLTHDISASLCSNMWELKSNYAEARIPFKSYHNDMQLTVNISLFPFHIQR